MPNASVTLYDDEGDSTELAGKYVVCPRCNGRGSHVNPSIDGNGLSCEDFDEAGPEFRDDYMSGVYDVTCEECHGDRVVAAPDFERWTPEQRTNWDRQELAREQDRRIEAAERSRGA